MALLGSSVDPRLFIQDYSGFTRAAEIQAQGMQNLGAAIGQGIKDFGEAREERKKLDAQVKADDVSIESAIKLGESLGIDIKSYLEPIQALRKDPNTTPAQSLALGRAAAQGISNAFTLGIGAQDRAAKLEQVRAENLYKQGMLEASQMRAGASVLNAKAAAQPNYTFQEYNVKNPLTGEDEKSKLPVNPKTGRPRDIEANRDILNVQDWYENKGGLAPEEPAMPTPTSQIAPSGQINQSALSSPLRQYAQSFEEYGNKYGVDPALLAAIAEHETGGGKSSAFRNKNNAMGVSNASGPVKMPSVEASIEKMASLLGRGINEGKGPYANAKSIEDIGRRYAPIGAGNDPGNLNKFWTRGVSSKYKKLATPQQIDNAISMGGDMTQQAMGTPQQQAEIARMIEEGQGMAMTQNTPQGAVPAEPSMATQQPQLPQQATPKVNLRPGFAPVRPQGNKPTTTMSAEQVRNLEQQGFRVSAIPNPDGTFMVSGVTTGGSSSGFEVTTPEGTTVRYGGANGLTQPKVGQGLQLVPDPTSPTGTRAVPVPGGEAEKAAQQEAAAAEIEKARGVELGLVAIAEIDNFINYTDEMSKLPFASPVRKAFGAFGMEEQAEAQSSLDTVTANLKFEALSALRKSSPSGASGLGQVTQNEFTALADQWGALKLTGDPEKIKERAIRVKKQLLDIVHGSQKYRDLLLKKGVITEQQYNEIQSQYPGSKVASQEDANLSRWRKIFTPQSTQ